MMFHSFVNNLLQSQSHVELFQEYFVRTKELQMRVRNNIEAIRSFLAGGIEQEITAEDQPPQGIVLPPPENIGVLAFEESILEGFSDDLAQMISLLAPTNAGRGLASEVGAAQERVAHHQSVFDTINKQEPVLSDPQYCDKLERWELQWQKHKKKLDAAYTHLAWVQWQQSHAKNDPVWHLKAEERIAIELEFNRIMNEVQDILSELTFILGKGEHVTATALHAWAATDNCMGRAAGLALKAVDTEKEQTMFGWHQTDTRVTGHEANIPAGRNNGSSVHPAARRRFVRTKSPQAIQKLVGSHRIKPERADQYFQQLGDNAPDVRVHYASACSLYDCSRKMLITLLDDRAEGMEREQEILLADARNAVQKDLNVIVHACNRTFLQELDEQKTPRIPSEEEFARTVSSFVHDQPMQIHSGVDAFTASVTDLSMTAMRFYWLEFQNALRSHKVIATAYENVIREVSLLNADERQIACKYVSDCLSPLGKSSSALDRISRCEEIKSVTADFLHAIAVHQFHAAGSASGRAVRLDLMHHLL